MESRAIPMTQILAEDLSLEPLTSLMSELTPTGEKYRRAIPQSALIQVKAKGCRRITLWIEGIILQMEGIPDTTSFGT